MFVVKSPKESNLDLKEQAKAAQVADHLKEEAVISPWRIVLRNFRSNRLGMIGLISFIIIFLIIFVGSRFLPFDPYYNMGVMRNICPGSGYMEIPQAMLDEGVATIASGTTYSAGTSRSGKFYSWGMDSLGNLTMPEEIAAAIEGKFVEQVVAGDKHILIRTGDDMVYGWGNNQFKQAEFPPNLQKIAAEEGIAKIGAGDAYSVLLTDNGSIHVWGSTLPNRLNRIPSDIQGHVVDFVEGPINILVLLDDGSIRLIGTKGSEIDTAMPEHLREPGNKIVDFARIQYSGVVVYEDGTMEAWGSRNEAADNFPEMEGKVIKVDAGRLHFVALTDAGKVYAWGQDNYNSTQVPEMDGVEDIFAGFFNNYATKNDGHDYIAWGLDGFPLGSDDMGRSLAGRLLHGGKMTLLVAFVSIVISVSIGIVVGLISGYYGGWIDNLLMRFSEIIASFPFYPLVITLTAVLPAGLSQYKRLAMIMVLLGILGWTGTARMVRGQIISEREKDYITASKALGLPDRRIIWSHILPNVISIVIVQLTLGFASNLLVEAGLSFLGFGVVEPNPSWGNMMTAAQSADVMEYYWWRWIFPGLATFLTALTVNLIGDALRDCLDPKAMER